VRAPAPPAGAAVRLATGRLARRAALAAALLGSGGTAGLTRARLAPLLEDGPDAAQTLEALLDGVAPPEAPSVPEAGRQMASGLPDEVAAGRRPPGRVPAGERRPPWQAASSGRCLPARPGGRTATSLDPSADASADDGGVPVRHLPPLGAPGQGAVAPLDRRELSVAATFGAATPVGRPQPGRTFVVAGSGSPTGVAARVGRPQPGRAFVVAGSVSPVAGAAPVANVPDDRPRPRDGALANAMQPPDGGPAPTFVTGARNPEVRGQAHGAEPARPTRRDTAGLARTETSKLVVRPGDGPRPHPAAGLPDRRTEAPLAPPGGCGLADLVARFDAAPPREATSASWSAEATAPARAYDAAPVLVASDDRLRARDAIREALEDLLVEEAHACGLEVRP
jgi:hypothetical protein